MAPSAEGSPGTCWPGGRPTDEQSIWSLRSVSACFASPNRSQDPKPSVALKPNVVQMFSMFTLREIRYFMNVARLARPESSLIAAALGAVGDASQLSFDIEQLGPEAADRRDGVVRVRSPASQTTYDIVTKGRLRPAMLGTLIAQLASLQARDPSRPLLLVTEHASPTIIDRLVAASVQFIDAAGNAYLTGPGLYVYCRGQERPDAGVRSAESLTTAKLEVLFVLLQDKSLRNADYREVAAAAGVSLGTVSNATKALRARGYVTGGESRRLAFDAALAAWELHYADLLRAKFLRGRFTCRDFGLQDLPDRLRDGLADAGAFALGGELGASLLTGYLRPASAAVYAQLDPRQFIRHLRVVPADDGEIALYAPITPRVATPGPDRIADPILIRAELLASGGDRQREVADLILRDHILPREAGAVR